MSFLGLSFSFPAAFFDPKNVPHGPCPGAPGYNEHGYRGASFAERGDLNILCIGDERVEGVGLSDGETLSRLLEALTSDRVGRSVRCWNAGRRDKGIDYVGRMIGCTKAVLKPDFVVVLLAPFLRREFFTETGECLDYTPERAGLAKSGQMRLRRREREVLAHLDAIANPYMAAATVTKWMRYIGRTLQNSDIGWCYGAVGTSADEPWLTLLLERRLLDPSIYLHAHQAPSGGSLAEQIARFARPAAEHIASRVAPAMHRSASLGG